MAVKIKLMRLGKIRAPYYRIVVADARTKRDGRAIEEIGKYHPTHEPSLIEVDSERAQYWLSVGAQPTEPVTAILKVTGDWQKFKGEPGAEGTLRVAEPKKDKKSVFEAAAKEGTGGADAEGKGAATTPKKKAAKKVAAQAAEGTDAARPTADEAAAEGDVRAAGSESATPATDAAPPTEPAAAPAEAAAPADDDAAKATVDTAEAAPAVEETTEVRSIEADSAESATEEA